MPINYVSSFLGHTNLTTISRYLNIHRWALHLAMQKFDESRRLASSCKEEAADQPTPSEDAGRPASEKLPIC